MLIQIWNIAVKLSGRLTFNLSAFSMALAIRLCS